MDTQQQHLQQSHGEHAVGKVGCGTKTMLKPQGMQYVFVVIHCQQCHCCCTAHTPAPAPEEAAGNKQIETHQRGCEELHKEDIHELRQSLEDMKAYFVDLEDKQTQQDAGIQKMQDDLGDSNFETQRRLKELESWVSNFGGREGQQGVGDFQQRQKPVEKVDGLPPAYEQKKKDFEKLNEAETAKEAAREAARKLEQAEAAKKAEKDVEERGSKAAKKAEAEKAKRAAKEATMEDSKEAEKAKEGSKGKGTSLKFPKEAKELSRNEDDDAIFKEMYEKCLSEGCDKATALEIAGDVIKAKRNCESIAGC